MCINGKLAQIRLHFEWYSDAPGVIWPSLPAVTWAWGLGFYVIVPCVEKTLNFHSQALKIKSLTEKFQPLSPFDKPEEATTHRASALPHSSAWLERSWGLPFRECVLSHGPGSYLVGHTTAHLLSLLETFVHMTPSVTRGREPDSGVHVYRRQVNESPSALTEGRVVSVTS